MQRGNLVMFLVLSLGILLGWIFFQNRIWPPKQKNLAKTEETKKDDGKAEREHGKLVEGFKKLPPAAQINIALTPFQSAHPLQELVWLHHWFNPGENSPKLLQPEDKKLAGLSFLIPPPISPELSLARLAPLKEFKLPTPKEEVATKEPEKATIVTIGGDDYFIEAKLTSLGAGVQALWLTKFEAANYLGKPVKGDDQRLELIQEDPFFPSFLMSHYEDPTKKREDKEDRPDHTLGITHWKLESKKVEKEKDDKPPHQEVVFSTTIPSGAFKGLSIQKTYLLQPQDYHLTLILKFEFPSLPKEAESKSLKFRYQLMGSHGMPIEGEWYSGTRRDVVIGLVNNGGHVERNRQESAAISHKEGGTAFPETMPENYFLVYAGTATQYFGSVIGVDKNQPSIEKGGKTRQSILSWARPTKESAEIPARIEEIEGDTLTASDPSKPGDPEKLYYLLPRTKKHLEVVGLAEKAKVVISYYTTHDGKRIATWIRPGQSPRPFFDDITVRVNSSELALDSGKPVSHQFMLYHGPVKTRLLSQFGGDKAVPDETVQKYTDDLHLYTLTDYRSDGFFGWLSQKIMFTNLLIFVTNLMHTLLYWFSFLVGNYGLAIILLTVVVRGMMFPISRKQALFSIKMQMLAPELKKIQEKYKNDPRGRTEATMEFYRKHRVNPLGSCLPLLLQMPIFLGLYFALQESIHFRLAGFLWIENLSAPDMFLYWSQSIPWVSDPDNIGGFFFLGPYLNLLPILAVVLMMVQQSMMAPPVMDEQQAMQMKVMKFMMIFIAILFYKVAAGLAVYFIASSLWGLAERRLLPKKEIQGPGFAPVVGKGGPSGKGGPPSKGGGPGKNKTPQPEETGAFSRLKKWWQNVLKEAKKK